eukprot:4084514-Pleurochrysis_carterae.AAC.1
MLYTLIESASTFESPLLVNILRPGLRAYLARCCSWTRLLFRTCTPGGSLVKHLPSLPGLASLMIRKINIHPANIVTYCSLRRCREWRRDGFTYTSLSIQIYKYST